jgi:hypothetical protein
MKNTFSILKKIFILSLIMVFCQGSAYALDEYYDWASGYKVRSAESMDWETFFKLQPITGGGFVGPQPLMSRWQVHQGNWTSTFPQCRDYKDPPCDSEGRASQSGWLFTYTCDGDVSWNLQASEDARDLIGGDTMYGSWSMLFSYFPPVLDEKNCSQFGRCFVGNAFILDTKAQKEESPDRMWALGVKGLVEGPGDVFFFDQVRAMTQPPKDYAFEYNNPYLVGDTVPGSPVYSGACDGVLFGNQVGSRDVLAYTQTAFDSEVIEHLPDVLPAYAAAQEATGIPCEILAGIHYVEGGNDPTKSLWDGGALHGANLTEDAIFTAEEIRDSLDGVHGWPCPCDADLPGYVAAATLHNGPGNRNCNPEQPGLYCYNAGGYVPTRWRLGGKCSPLQETDYGPLEDSLYALAYVDAKHEDMDIIFKTDYDGTCNSFFIPPEPTQTPGVLAIAFALHKYITGQ